MIYPWTTMPCAVCGCEHLATRAFPLDADESVCGECETFESAHTEAMAEVMKVIHTRIGIATAINDSCAISELRRLLKDLQLPQPEDGP